MDKIKGLLLEFKTGLSSIYGSRLKGVYLYGSYAKGTQDAESDLDIIIVLEEFSNYAEEVDRVGKLGSDLSLKYNVSISKVFVRESEWAHKATFFLSSVGQEAIAA